MAKLHAHVRAWTVTAACVTTVGLTGVGPIPAADAVSRTADPGYQTNGRVTTIVTVRNTVYIGGDFTTVRPSGAAQGTHEVARDHLAAFRLDTGALRSWNPGANGDVSALAASPNGRTLFVGGAFTRLSGTKRHHVGAVSTRSGATTRFKAGTNAAVLAIAVAKSRVYLGGSFTKVGDHRRRHLAATDRRGRVLRHWKARASGDVRSLALSRDRHKVYVGGDFSAINRHHDEHLAVLGAVSGKVLRWRKHPGYAVWDIVVRKHGVYVGGNGVGGRVGAFTPTGRPRWAVQTDGGVQAIASIGRKIVAGGHFYNVCVGVSPGKTPGFDCPQVKAHRPHLLALSAKKGNLKAWSPRANSILGVFALTSSGPGIYAGGDFTRMSGTDQQGLARFS